MRFLSSVAVLVVTCHLKRVLASVDYGLSVTVDAERQKVGYVLELLAEKRRALISRPCQTGVEDARRRTDAVPSWAT